MKKHVFCLIAICCTCLNLCAHEGLWPLYDATGHLYPTLKNDGCKLSPEALYHPLKPSLKDAVVGLSNHGSDIESFATASFISSEGLLLTNYHVVLSHVQRHSSDKNDFLKFGLWAENRSQEPHCFGLQVMVLQRQENVSTLLLEGTSGLNGKARTDRVNENAKVLTEKIQKENPNYQIKISSLMGGSRYELNVYIVYKDVRLVAAPPMQIGKYAGDYENWKWPRHTGDFALLRVYASKNQEPAEHSKDNVPLIPKYFLPINTSGIQENDFSFTLGFPSRTLYYIPSFAVEKIAHQDLSARVSIREEKLRILRESIEKNPALRLRYTTLTHSIENSYLRWKGEIDGIDRMNLIALKQDEEQAYRSWVSQNPEQRQIYMDALNGLEKNYTQLSAYNLANIYFEEAGLQGAEVVPFAGKFEKLMAMFARKTLNEKAIKNEAQRLIPLVHQFFYNYDTLLDRQFFRNMFLIYFQNMPIEFHPEEMTTAHKRYSGDIDRYSKEAYASSIFMKKDSLIHFLNQVHLNGPERMKQDPLYQMAIGYYRINVDKIAPVRVRLQQEQSELMSIYQRGILEKNQDVLLFPDAARSLRCSYGHIVPVENFAWQTDMDGLIRKAATYGDSAGYYVPQKLRRLYQDQDFGPWATPQKPLPINFILNSHTSSGNSGSPILNANGELIGLNFDRYHKGVASDYRYIPELSRSIGVDIRYILFLLDKYSPVSSYLIKELNIKK